MTMQAQATEVMIERAKELVEKCSSSGEPCVVFRAKDFFSVQVLGAYIDMIERHGPSDPEFQQRVVEARNAFREWQASNIEKVKYPD
jgi:hypothetical protein